MKNVNLISPTGQTVLVSGESYKQNSAKFKKLGFRKQGDKSEDLKTEVVLLRQGNGPIITVTKSTFESEKNKVHYASYRQLDEKEVMDFYGIEGEPEKKTELKLAAPKPEKKTEPKEVK